MQQPLEFAGKRHDQSVAPFYLPGQSRLCPLTNPIKLRPMNRRVFLFGAEFSHHCKQTSADIRVVDAKHPVTQGLCEHWQLEREELYQLKHYEAEKVTELLVLDGHPETGAPGNFLLAWTKDYEKGRVFYSALGHRDDLWNDDPELKDRVNSPEVSRQFLGHLQGDIVWALGLME